MPKLNGADYLLLLLYLNNKEPIYGAVRLEKMMFLFNNEIAPVLKGKGLDSDKLPEFIAYNFGPFSKDVYEQVELFKAIKFIAVTDIKVKANEKEKMLEVDDWEEGPYVDGLTNSSSDNNADGKYYKYYILKTGEKYVEEEILPIMNNNQVDLLKCFKKKITSLYPKQLLKYVYSRYPEFTKNSLIIDEVFDDE